MQRSAFLLDAIPSLSTYTCDGWERAGEKSKRCESRAFSESGKSTKPYFHIGKHSSWTFVQFSKPDASFWIVPLKVRELGLAVMLLGVVVVFLLCNVLALIANLLEVESVVDQSKLTGLYFQHFFGTLIHQLTQTNNLLVTVNRCPQSLWSWTPLRYDFSCFQLGKLHNLLHLWREVPTGFAAEGGRLSGLPPPDSFHPPAGAPQSWGFKLLLRWFSPSNIVPNNRSSTISRFQIIISLILV